MTRLLLLAAVVAIVVVLRRREPIARAPLYREDDDGLPPTDPRLWQHVTSWTDA